jgi:hypothetical protein
VAARFYNFDDGIGYLTNPSSGVSRIILMKMT